MRNAWMGALILFVFVSLAAGQSKVETKWHCAKPADRQFEVGDMPDHIYAVAQGQCEAVRSAAGEKTGIFTEFQDINKASFTTRGRFVVTMDDSTKMYYSYEASGSASKMTALEHWKNDGGTGKHASDRGSGTCSGKLNDDGTSDWVCSGTTTAGN